MDYDKFGHCVLCHKCMVIQEVIDQKVQIRFTPEYTEQELLLDDGSYMRVAMCKDCQKAHSKKDYPKIMEMVRNGWEEELKNLNWTEEKKSAYRNKYYKLNVETKRGKKWG